MKVAGIDVSSKTVTLVIHRDGRMGKPCELKNTPQGHATLSNRLRKVKVSRVCLEATGQYHLVLALDDAGLARMVINPKAAKCFAEAMQPCTKTDAVDAAVLAVRPAHALHALAAPRRPGPGHPRLRAPHRSDQPAPHPQPRTSSMRCNKPRRHPTSGASPFFAQPEMGSVRFRLQTMGRRPLPSAARVRPAPIPARTPRGTRTPAMT